MTKKIINLTPHDLNIVANDGSTVTINRSGNIARVAQTELVSATINEFDVTSIEYGAVENLPAEKDGVYYVVSRMVASAVPGRSDLLVPGPLVRDDEGRVIGARGFSFPN